MCGVQLVTAVNLTATTSQLVTIMAVVKIPSELQTVYSKIFSISVIYF